VCVYKYTYIYIYIIIIMIYVVYHMICVRVVVANHMVALP
jgi:hypothetical protein